jgi:hypothetical protein
LVSRSVIVALVAAVFSLVTAPVAAHADVTGSIDYATATPDWLHGSFGGSITYGLCDQRVDCKWSGLIILQVSSQSCDSEDPFQGGDRNVFVVAATGDQSADATIPLSAQSWPILPGVQGQRLCLYLRERGRVREPDPLCDIDPLNCNPDGIIRQLNFYATIAQRLFVVEAQPPPPSPPPPPPVVKQGGPQLRLSKKTALSKAKAALARKFGRAYRRGRKKRVSCKPLAASAGGARASTADYRCAFSFRYRSKKRAGTVIVRRTPDGIKTTIEGRR